MTEGTERTDLPHADYADDTGIYKYTRNGTIECSTLRIN